MEMQLVSRIFYDNVVPVTMTLYTVPDPYLRVDMDENSVHEEYWEITYFLGRWVM